MENYKSTPKDVFYHLLMIVMLYIGVISFIALLFQYANVLFPDQLEWYYTGALDVIRRSMAALVVVWPVFLFMTWVMEKDFRKNLGKRNMRVRKWLLYLTLFVSAVTIIVDLITLVYNFLGGELSTRFILKVVAILITAAAVFGYYMWDLRSEDNRKSSLPKRSAVASSIVILFGIIGGFFIVGSPNTQRAIRFDDQRTSDLQTLQWQIVDYWTRKETLPTKLDDLQNSLNGFTVPLDPRTKAQYEYRVVEKLKFELCATFEKSTAAGQTSLLTGKRPEAMPVNYGAEGNLGTNWGHDVGRTCFERTIDPTIYKPLSAIKQ